MINLRKDLMIIFFNLNSAISKKCSIEVEFSIIEKIKIPLMHLNIESILESKLYEL
jgi:hypothetical protein